MGINKSACIISKKKTRVLVYQEKNGFNSFKKRGDTHQLFPEPFKSVKFSALSDYIIYFNATQV